MIPSIIIEADIAGSRLVHLLWESLHEITFLEKETLKLGEVLAQQIITRKNGESTRPPFPKTIPKGRPA